jgi:hypothetical protein
MFNGSGILAHASTVLRRMSSRAESDAKYNRSEKGRARHERYNATGKGWARNNRYEHTAAGMRRKIECDIRRGRDPEWILDGSRATRSANARSYEASGTSLPFFDWLNETYPLPKLRMPAL